LLPMHCRLSTQSAPAMLSQPPSMMCTKVCDVPAQGAGKYTLQGCRVQMVRFYRQSQQHSASATQSPSAWPVAAPVPLLALAQPIGPLVFQHLFILFVAVPALLPLLFVFASSFVDPTLYFACSCAQAPTAPCMLAMATTRSLSA
jgi:hypothetical protein